MPHGVRLQALATLLVLWALFCLTLASSRARAGGGPENVLLIVNENSESSKTIANHYIALRKIPPDNVLYLDWKGNLESGLAVYLRDNILVPALAALDERKIVSQIDYIVYSSDFPWRFFLKPPYSDDEFHGAFDAWGSITGETYLLSYLKNTAPGIVSPVSNWYVPGPRGLNEGRCTQLANVPSRGFRSQYLWDPQGNKIVGKTGGQRYMLSTMLGVTQGRGNTVDEVISYLRRSAAADGTRPQGTIYLMWNKDIRSATRDKCFESVAAQINRLGVRAKVQQGRLPDGAKDVTGLMVGAADFDVVKSGIAIRPGAICEHLTSAGGILFDQKFQTPLSDFLRQGAAGASGTIAEPHAIQAKFPLPSLQLHYARGCSLAEAFYQSISAPYQILIVGDPLCQPWAAAPKMAVQGITAGATVKGTITITPRGIAGGGRPLGAVEVFVDGKLVAGISANSTLDIDTTKLPDGYHELRVVGINSDPIESQGRVIVPFNVGNHDATVEFKVSPYQVKFIDKLRFTVRQPGAKGITIRQNSRDVARVEGEEGEVEIAAAELGRGPSRLQAFSEGDVQAVSAPARVLVQ